MLEFIVRLLGIDQTLTMFQISGSLPIILSIAHIFSSRDVLAIGRTIVT